MEEYIICTCESVTQKFELISKNNEIHVRAVQKEDHSQNGLRPLPVWRNAVLTVTEAKKLRLFLNQTLDGKVHPADFLETYYSYQTC